MNRSFALTLPVLTACIGLVGCTIYTYPAKPPQKPGKAKPAPTATAKRPGGLVLGGKRPRGTAGAATAEPDLPTVTGQTIFGGPTKTSIQGLAFVIPEGTTKMPNFDDLVPFALLYTNQFNIVSQTFSGGFPGALQQDEWFGIQYTGNFQVPSAGKFTLTLISDDGAVLYVDSVKVIDNDGVHAAKSAVAQVDLTAGSHALRLDYFQEKKGTVALQLLVNLAGRDVPVVAYP